MNRKTIALVLIGFVLIGTGCIGGPQQAIWEQELNETQEENATIEENVTQGETEEHEFEITVYNTEKGTTDPEPGVYYHQEEEEVTVEAIPNEGYDFELWERSGSARECEKYERTCTFTITNDSMLAAHFKEKKKDYYELTTNIEGEGSIKIAPNQKEYLEGTEVNLTARPDQNWTFQEWQIGAYGNDNPKTTIEMNEDKNVTAVFAPLEGEEQCEKEVEDAQEHASGRMCTQQVKNLQCPHVDTKFVYLARNGCEINYLEERGWHTPEKTENNLEIEVYTEGGTTDPKTGNHSYTEGEEVTVKAIPDDGYNFQGWEREGSATECNQTKQNCTFNITEDSLLAAHFESDYQLY